MSNLLLPRNSQPRVIIVGGGFGGLTLARKLRKEKVQLILLDRHNYHTFQPLLYQVATAGLEPDSIAFPLRKIFKRHRNLIFRLAEVYGLDEERQQLRTSIGEIEYDYLVLATGSQTNFFGLTNVAEHVYPLKSLPEALNLRNIILQNFEQALLESDIGQREELMNFVVVGGGHTGVEVAGALGELKRHILPADYPELDIRRMQIHLVEASPKLLPGMSTESSDKAVKFLEQLAVTIWLNSPVTKCEHDVVQLGNDKIIRSNTVIWTAGVLGASLAGVPSSAIKQAGRIAVDEFNRVVGLKNVFAIGDLAVMQSSEQAKGHPMIAPVAIQQGALLGENLIRLIRGESLRRFHYRDMGLMATVGRHRAVVELGKLKLRGVIAWYFWLIIHLMKLVGFRNRMVVFVNWLWNYLTYDRGVRLIFKEVRHSASASYEDDSRPR